MVKSIPNIKGLNIFNHNYLYTAYADDTTSFLNDQKSIRELMITFKFSKFFGLKPNILKCEVAGMGSLERFKMTVCRVICRVVSCIDLATETLIVGMGVQEF